MEEIVEDGDLEAVLDRALNAGGGLLRLTPTWVPKFFLHPGKRIQLNPKHCYCFGEETDDEVFITHDSAIAGVEIENTGSEPLVGLRYFGPDTFESVPAVGAYRQ